MLRKCPPTTKYSRIHSTALVCKMVYLLTQDPHMETPDLGMTELAWPSGSPLGQVRADVIKLRCKSNKGRGKWHNWEILCLFNIMLTLLDHNIMIQLKYCHLQVPIPSIHVNVTTDFLFLLQKFQQAICLTADILTCENRAGYCTSKRNQAMTNVIIDACKTT